MVVVFVADAPLYPFGQRFAAFGGGGGEQFPHVGGLFAAGDEDAELGGGAVDQGAVLVFVAAGGGEGVVEPGDVVGEGAGGGGGVGDEEVEAVGDFAVLPQPDGVGAVVGQVERRFAAEVELPFVEAVEQGGGGFVGKAAGFAFVGEADDAVEHGRQFVEHPQGLVEGVFGGEAADGFFGEVVRFVDAVEAVFGGGQDDAAAHGDVGEQQVVVGDDDVYRFEGVAGEVEGAFGAVGTGVFQAAVAVVGDLLPERVGDFFRPLVAVAVEAAGGKFVGDAVEGVQIGGAGFVVPQDGGRAVETGERTLGVRLRELVELVGAEVAAAPFGQGEGEFEAAVADEKG